MPLCPGSVRLSGYRPGAIGRITELHGTYYAERWGLGPQFEAEVATELAEFVSRFDPSHDLLLLAVADGRVLGSVAIDGRERASAGARLRWFILAPEAQGLGLGARLIAEALAFCRRAGMPRVYLWTFAGLAAARRLYARAGFVLCEERAGDEWGRAVTHQRFELELY